ncbi:hypothetical protein GUJ93_ZPchr0009g1279 [Zizania palustris]|uniref:Histidine-containing phosphotransfer protein n=1 Tax=Zizania palustris TaxID=103762 RepID=A0A8J5R3A2_ZIZPA|nr:hypothetical protein GUJ93_ZPchr0009g1279 [Zizania palustris]
MAAAALREQLNALLSSMFSQGLVDEQFQQLQMLQDEGGTPGFVAEVVTLFCDDAERIIAEIATLLEQPIVNFDKVDAYVHQLKGSSASVGAQKVKFTCMQFRQLCQEKSRDGCLMALAVVRNDFYDLRNKFQTMLQVVPYLFFLVFDLQIITTYKVMIDNVCVSCNLKITTLVFLLLKFITRYIMARSYAGSF